MKKIFLSLALLLSFNCYSQMDSLKVSMLHQPKDTSRKVDIKLLKLTFDYYSDDVKLLLGGTAIAVLGFLDVQDQNSFNKVGYFPFILGSAIDVIAIGRMIRTTIKNKQVRSILL